MSFNNEAGAGAAHPDNVHVVLASQSPRRRDLLTLIGIRHDVQPADIDETVMPGEEPVPHCERLAREKVNVITHRHPRSLVVGSDTIVVVDGDILGKPASRDEAIAMISRLAGREHTVHTAVAVAHAERIVSGVETVRVTFRALTAQQVADYVDTGEPMDKAGAYGIQGFGAAIVERVDGDYFAVMGLPIGRMLTLMRSLGFDYRFPRLERTG